MKKGILMALGMLMFSSLVLSLAILLFHNTQGTEDRFAELSLYGRMHDLDSSLQKGFLEILNRNSGINLFKLNDTVHISETLPGSTSFSTEISNYISYIEEQYVSYPNISIDASVLNTLKTEMPFKIMPHDITIDHTTFPTGNMEITPQSANVARYNITLSTSMSTVAFTPSITAGAFPLKITVTTSSGSNTQEYGIDETAASTVVLTLNSGLPSETDVTITVNDPAHLLIDRNGVALGHSIDIEFIDQPEQMTQVFLPDNLFMIDFPVEGLNKTGTVRIL